VVVHYFDNLTYPRTCLSSFTWKSWIALQ
jgi:hypothetical protein